MILGGHETADLYGTCLRKQQNGAATRGPARLVFLGIMNVCTQRAYNAHDH